MSTSAQVRAVHAKASHSFSKEPLAAIELVAGLGVEGDAHFGVTVQHQSHAARDPTRPNLRQVHLIHQELLDELTRSGLPVAPGQLGENITTLGIPLLALAEGTVLRIGADARVQVTGLRNPCRQIEQFKAGLLDAVLDRTPDGQLIRKTGIMAVVLQSGLIVPGDFIEILHAPVPHSPLRPV